MIDRAILAVTWWEVLAGLAAAVVFLAWLTLKWDEHQGHTHEAWDRWNDGRRL